MIISAQGVERELSSKVKNIGVSAFRVFSAEIHICKWGKGKLTRAKSSKFELKKIVS